MKKHRSRAVVPLFLLAVYLLLLLTKLIPEESLDSVPALFFALVVAELLVFALPAFLFCKLKGNDYVKELPLRAFPLRRLPFLAAMTAVMLFAGLLINAFFYHIGIGSASYTSLGTFIFSDHSLETNFLYVVFAYGALPALAEEFLFRGILLTEYNKYSFVTAALVSAAAYAFCYFDLTSFPFYFISGLLLAYVVRMTGSVFAAVLVRFVVNIASVWVMPALWNLMIQPLGVLFAFFLAAVFFFVALFFALRSTAAVYRDMAHDPSHASDEAPRGTTVRRNTLKAFLSPTFLLCFFTYVTVSIIRLIVGS